MLFFHSPAVGSVKGQGFGGLGRGTGEGWRRDGEWREGGG